MTLYLLRPNENLQGCDPWEPWYDKNFGFVIRADSEQEARQLASKEGGDENTEDYTGGKRKCVYSPWSDPQASTCEELLAEGETTLIITDFRAA